MFIYTVPSLPWLTISIPSNPECTPGELHRHHSSAREREEGLPPNQSGSLFRDGLLAGGGLPSQSLWCGQLLAAIV